MHAAGFDDGVALGRAAPLQTVGGADAGQACTDDQDVQNLKVGLRASGGHGASIQG